MTADDNEEKLLRSVALQNARAVLLARERAEAALVEAKQELQRKNEELAQQHEWFKVTLSSIGDGVVTTDTQGRLTFMNPVAEGLTGWSSADALGKPLDKVFVIVNEQTLKPVEHPVKKTLRDGVVVSLANHTVLIRRDGTKVAIEDSAAPIRNLAGEMIGAVMVFHDVTDRRVRETELRRSEELNRSIIESSPDCIKIIDLAGNLISISHNGQRMLGLTDITPYLNKPWADLWRGEYYDRAVALIQAAARGETNSFRGAVKNAKGETKYWEVVATPIIGPEGKPERILVISHDEAERRKTEEQAARLAAVIESSDDSIVSMSLDGIVTTWNAGAQRMYGYTAKEMIGRPVTALVPLNKPDEEPEILERLKRGEHIDHYETIRRTKSGAELNVSLTVSPILDSTGKIIGASKIARDITRRIRTEEALRRNEEDLRSLANSISQLAWMAMPDGNIFWYNQRWYEYTCTTLEQMQGWGWQAVHDPEILPKVVERWSESLRTGAPFHMEFPLRGADGRFRWFLTRAVPVRDSEGKIVRWFGTNTDVDDVRRAREQLSTHAEQLEKQVAERTGALREKIGELEAFSYSISHDLRAPLRAIRSFALILEQESSAKLNEEEQQYLRRIAEASARMDRLIQDVLNYSRIARMEAPIEQVDLDNLLHGVVESYPLFHPPAALIDLVGTFPPVLGSEAILTQCLSNLLSNAVKFVSPGVTPKVRVWAETFEEGRKVKVFFKDNGVGIPPGMHQKIFGIFERVSNNYEGTGIGLSIVKKGVERMGGAVGLESQLGVGATFWLELNRPALTA